MMFALYKKELGSFFRSPIAYVVSALFLLIFSISIISSIANISGSDTLSFSFSSILYNNSMFFIILIPVLTMKSFPDERKNNTEVLLMSSPLSLTKIVLAKFLSVATVYALMMILSLFYPIVTIFMGSVIWSSLISAYIGFFLWGLVCIAIGIFISSFFESNIISVIISEAVMLLIIGLNSLVNTAYFSDHRVLGNILQFFSNSSRFAIFSQGMFRLTDVIFFLTMIILFLIFTVIVLERRRWSRG